MFDMQRRILCKLKGDNMKVNVKTLKDKNKTTIIMVRNGYGTATTVNTKDIKKKGIPGAILEMLDESLKEAGKSGI